MARTPAPEPPKYWASFDAATVYGVGRTRAEAADAAPADGAFEVARIDRALHRYVERHGWDRLRDRFEVRDGWLYRLPAGPAR